MLWTAAQIANATGGDARGGSHRGPVATDTRSMPAEAWFVALVGPRFDGHDYAAAAWQAGARGGVFQRAPEGWSGPWVEVADTTVALQDLGRTARTRLTVPVVGLTGSNGKTTTRALTALALSPLGAVHQTTGNLNNHLGVPMTLCAAPEGADAVVLEMGTSGPGEIAFLVEIGRPDVRVVINVGPAHLEELGGLDGVAFEKGSMFRSARPADTLIVNADDDRVRAMEGAGRRILYGRADDADIRLVEHVMNAEAWCAELAWDTPMGKVTGRLADPSPFVAHNATAALGVAHALGVDLQAAADALQAYAPVGMRLAPQRLPGGPLLVVDAYNANPGSVRASLSLLCSLGGRRVAVLGDMLELGAHEASMHDAIVTEALALGLDDVVVVGPRMSAAAARVGGAVAFHDADGVAAHLAGALTPDTRLLLKASRGMRLERVRDDLLALLEDAP